MPHSKAIDELLHVVRRAGDLLLEMWPGGSLRLKGKTRDDLRVQNKSDGSLVCEADMASNRILIEGLSRLFPNDAILSEEIPLDPAQLAKSKRTWIIDPLDGTTSFVHGRDDFSVLVGLSEEGIPTTGLMFFPALAHFVVSLPGMRATLNGEPLVVSDASHVAPGRIYIRNFSCSRPELACAEMDSGLALRKVASGELDGAIIRMTTHQEWDLAAPAAVLFSSGGALSTETGRPIEFGRGIIDFKYAIASNGKIHKQLLDLIGNSPRPNRVVGVIFCAVPPTFC